jgi:hypothetical protein
VAGDPEGYAGCLRSLVMLVEELVAHLAAERARLRRAEVMGVRGLPGADQAGLRRDELAMCFVADAPRFADRKHAFVDAATDATARGAERIVGVQPRTRCRDMRQHSGGSRWGLLGVGVRKAPCPALDSRPQPVTGSPSPGRPSPKTASFSRNPASTRSASAAVSVFLAGRLRWAQLAASSAD